MAIKTDKEITLFPGGNGSVPTEEGELLPALDAVLVGKPVAKEQKPGIGCNIKWKPGNEPDYS